MAKGSLQNVFSQGFTGVNLFDISVVQDTDPDLPFYKNKFFVFLSMTPGVAGQNGGRTFNKDGKITIKTDFVKLMSIGHALRGLINGPGQGKTLGQFTIFVDPSKSEYGNSANGSKMIFCGEYIPKDKNSGVEDFNKRQISISFKQGQGAIMGVSFSPTEALAVADVLEIMGRKGIDLEFSSRCASVGMVKQPPQSNGNNTSYNNNRSTPPGPPSANDVANNFQGAMEGMFGDVPEPPF